MTGARPTNAGPNKARLAGTRPAAAPATAARAAPAGRILSGIAADRPNPSIVDRIRGANRTSARCLVIGLENWAILLLSAQLFVAGIVMLIAVAPPAFAVRVRGSSMLGETLAALACLLVAAVALMHATRATRVVRALALHNQDLDIAAHSDALTNLGNRRLFETDLLEQWRATAAAEAPLSLLIVDVDHFKAFNDTHGHPEGDLLLREMSDALTGAMRLGEGHAYRYGGEEFAVLLPGIGLRQARAVAERISRSIRDLPTHDSPDPGPSEAADRPRDAVPETVPSVRPGVTVSIGVAASLPGARPDDAEHLVRAADAALYRAKREGRDRIIVADLERSSARPSNGAIESSGAVDRAGAIDRFEIVLTNGRIVRIAHSVDAQTFASIVSLVGEA